MIDYYETKTNPITKKMVLEAYKKVRDNGGSAGVDQQDLESYAKNLQRNLYKLWNRLTSGSYFPSPVREVICPACRDEGCEPGAPDSWEEIPGG